MSYFFIFTRYLIIRCRSEVRPYILGFYGALYTMHPSEEEAYEAFRAARRRRDVRNMAVIDLTQQVYHLDDSDG